MPLLVTNDETGNLPIQWKLDHMKKQTPDFTSTSFSIFTELYQILLLKK